MIEMRIHASATGAGAFVNDEGKDTTMIRGSSEGFGTRIGPMISCCYDSQLGLCTVCQSCSYQIT